jgi:hypothetical protein
VRVTVNSFEQPDARLDSPEGSRRSFRVPIRLNQDKSNKVEVDVPDLKLPARPSFRVDCATPLPEQRLHLLVLGPGETDQAGLRAEVAKSLGAAQVRGNRFSTKAFREAEVLGLRGDFQREDVTGALLRIRDRVRANTGPLNDVVVVYFRGEEKPTDEGHYLLTEATRLRGRPAETAVDCAEMRKLLADVPGAKLLLLDGSREGGGPPDDTYVTLVRRWDGAGSQVGVLHYLWLADPKTPQEAQLVTALREALAEARQLREVIRQVRERAERYEKRVIANSHIPDGQETLSLGGLAGR